MRWLCIIIIVTFTVSTNQTLATQDDSSTIRQHVMNLIQAWNNQPNFEGAELVTFEYDPRKIDNAIPLTIVIYNGSGWRDNEVLEKVASAIHIYYNYCRIHLNPILVVRATNKHGAVVSTKDPESFLADAKLESASLLAKPVYYFVADFIVSEPDREGAAGFAYVIPDDEPTEIGVRARNSGFIYRANALQPFANNGNLKGNPGEVEVLAHEVGHTLLRNRGHSSFEGNLMSERNATNFINSTQCDIMKANIISMKANAEQRRAAARLNPR